MKSPVCCQIPPCLFLPGGKRRVHGQSGLLFLGWFLVSLIYSPPPPPPLPRCHKVSSVRTGAVRTSINIWRKAHVKHRALYSPAAHSHSVCVYLAVWLLSTVDGWLDGGWNTVGRSQAAAALHDKILGQDSETQTVLYAVSAVGECVGMVTATVGHWMSEWMSVNEGWSQANTISTWMEAILKALRWYGQIYK